MRAPFVVASLVAVAGLGWATLLLVDPEPFAPSSAVAIAAGLVIYTVVAVTGILLVHAPWARWLAMGVVVAGSVLGAAVGFRLASWVVLLISAAAAMGLAGPWLDVWLRKRPAANAVGGRVTAMLLGAIGIVPLVGLAAPKQDAKLVRSIVSGNTTEQPLADKRSAHQRLLGIVIYAAAFAAQMLARHETRFV